MDKNLPFSLADDARESMKAVVQIYAEGYLADDPKSQLDPRVLRKDRWTGSGFFIKLKGQDGYILTNSHVVKNASSLKIMTVQTSEETYRTQVVGFVKSFEPDIALLKLEDFDLKRLKEAIGDIPSLIMADINEVKRGTEIKAIGYPLGMVEPNISGGEITNFISGTEDEAERFVTDAAINPGNSGGPSVMAGGKVVGINTSIIIDASNIGFITPIFYARILLENLSTGGAGGMSQLGGSYQRNSTPNAGYLGLEDSSGVIVKNVFPAGFLEGLGVQHKDVLLSIGGIRFDRYGQTVKDSEPSMRNKNLYDVIRFFPVGSEVEVEFISDGKLMKKKGQAKSNPLGAIRSNDDVYSRPYLWFEGMIIQPLSYELIESLVEAYSIDYKQLFKIISSQTASLVITHIDADGQADELFMEVGDTIKKIDNEVVSSLEEFSKKINILVKNSKTIFIETASGCIGSFHPLEEVRITQLTNPLQKKLNQDKL